MRTAFALHHVKDTNTKSTWHCIRFMWRTERQQCEKTTCVDNTNTTRHSTHYDPVRKFEKSETYVRYIHESQEEGEEIVKRLVLANNELILTTYCEFIIIVIRTNTSCCKINVKFSEDRCEWNVLIKPVQWARKHKFTQFKFRNLKNLKLPTLTTDSHISHWH